MTGKFLGCSLDAVADVIQMRNRGSGIASALSIAHSDRFLGFAFITVPYRPSAVFPPLNDILELQRRTFGRPLMGYWTLLLREDAASLIEANVRLSVENLSIYSPRGAWKFPTIKIDAFLDVVHPADPETWKTYMNLPGEFEVFLQQKKRLPRASYLTPEVYAALHHCLEKG